MGRVNNNYLIIGLPVIGEPDGGQVDSPSNPGGDVSAAMAFTGTADNAFAYYPNGENEKVSVAPTNGIFKVLADTSQWTSMSNMFRSCSSLTNLDLHKLDTSKVTNMSNMFCLCEALTSIDMNGFDTSKVTNMYNMFSGCPKLTSLDLSGFDTSSLTEVNSLFYGCTSLLSLDLSNFIMDNVRSKNNMFYLCNALNKIKCKQAFKDWCITNQDAIALPEAMREGGTGTWEIVSA